MSQLDTVCYLKENHGDHFSIIEFFEHFAFTKEEDAVREFKQAIGSLINMKRGSFVSWAKEISNKGFLILRSQSVVDYWDKLRIDISEKKVNVAVLEAKNRTFTSFLRKHSKERQSFRGGKKKSDKGGSKRKATEHEAESSNKKKKDTVEDNDGDDDELSIPSTNGKPSNQEQLLSWIRQFQKLDSEDQKIKSLVDILGQDGELDLEVLQISSWYKVIIETSLTNLKFPYMLTACEAHVLSYIHHCTSINELKALRRRLYRYDDIDDGIEYIRMAIDSLITLWKSRKLAKTNQECWWRQFVYTPLFDNAFLQLQEFDIKRSECASTAVDVFNGLVSTQYNQVIQKVDFALRNVEDGNDIMIGEDKPAHSSSRDVETDYCKNIKIRSLTSYVQQSKLPIKSLNRFFDPLTYIWHGRTLKVHGTHEFDGRMIHYEAASCTVPELPGSYDEVAKLLMTVLSLKRCIMYNKEKLDMIKHVLMTLLITKSNGSRSPVHTKTKESSFELDTDGMVEMAKLIIGLKYEEDQFVKAINEIELKDNGSVMISDDNRIEYFRNKPLLSEISTMICQKYLMNYDEDDDDDKLLFNLSSQEFDSSTPKRPSTPQL